MKKLITMILLIAFTTVSYGQTTYNPCKDSLYVLLQRKNIDSLSQREFDYFVLKTKECGEYTQQQKQLKADKDKMGAGGIILIVVFGLILLGLVGYTIDKAKKNN